MRKVSYILFISIILLMSWSNGKQDSVIAISNQSTIPEEAIRLRIIANSDSIEDQWLKREVTDVVVDQINQWVNKIENIDEARLIIEQNIPEIDRLVKEIIEVNGFTYHQSLKVELGTFPFPTKMYGQAVYPAGDYEALRITIGAGEGENWWCVLFPPLCFIDMSTSSAVQDIDAIEGIKTTIEDEDVEVRFFIADIVNKIKQFFKA